MHARKRGEVPARLVRLERRFAEWRRTRKRGERIPRSLWTSAAKLAAKYGVSQTATILKLDYVSLKSHLDRHDTDRSNSDATKATFVELPAPTISIVRECVIEFEDGAGASLRVHLKGHDVPDVLELGRRFWNAQ
jgi:hypothetical protein